jgi:hypothetical protein
VNEVEESEATRAALVAAAWERLRVSLAREESAALAAGDAERTAVAEVRQLVERAGARER